jgi:hypothetical protein
MNYFKLLDKENYGIIVRAKGRDQHEYSPGRGWVKSGALIQYFNDESEFYDLYEEISEGEALDLISDRKSA